MSCSVKSKVLFDAGQLADFGKQPVGFAVAWNGG